MGGRAPHPSSSDEAARGEDGAARGEGGAPGGRAGTCVLLLCGLPCAGKTTLAGKLSSAVPDLTAGAVRAKCITFDDVQRRGSGGAAAPVPFDPEAWRRGRAAALRMAGEEVSCGGSADRVVILDDNMHYRSMRREVAQMARAAGAAVVTIYLEAGLDEALARNASRGLEDPTRAIPADVVRRMHAQLEPPTPAEGPLLALAPGAVPPLEAIWQQVWERWGPPVDGSSSPEAVAAQGRAGRASNLESKVHQLDLRTRAAVSRAAERLALGGELSGALRPLSLARREMLTACKREARGLADDQEVDKLFAHHEEAFARLCEAENVSPPQLTVTISTNTAAEPEKVLPP